MRRTMALLLVALAAILPGRPAMSETTLPDFMELWDFQDPAGTEAAFLEILPRAREAGDLSYLARLLTQVARTRGLQRRFEEAHATLDEVEALLEGHDLPEARVLYLLERGRTFDSPVHPAEAKQTDRARECFLAAFEYGLQTGQEGRALDAAHMLGIVEPPQKALEWNLRSIEIAEASQDESARRWLGPLYNNTGWNYHDMGEHEKALALFERSLEWRRSRGEEPQVRIARWCVGRCLRSLGRVEEAMAMQRALLEEYEAAGAEEKGYVPEEIGECLWALGRTEEARPWLARAYERLSARESWLLDEDPGRMESLRARGAGE